MNIIRLDPSIIGPIANLEPSLCQDGFQYKYREKQNYFSGQILLGHTELVCTIPGCELVIFDLESGQLQRRLKLTGSKILAIAHHPTTRNKIRVATDEMIEIVDMY